jgi:predicted ATP-grasp superfamily ATP-dependent carboligase
MVIYLRENKFYTDNQNVITLLKEVKPEKNKATELFEEVFDVIEIPSHVSNEIGTHSIEETAKALKVLSFMLLSNQKTNVDTDNIIIEGEKAKNEIFEHIKKNEDPSMNKAYNMNMLSTLTSIGFNQVT